MIPHGVSYEEAMRQFRWPRPERFNIGRAVCERHPSHALALIVENTDGSVRNWTFGQLLAASSRLANALSAHGIRKGDRVGVFLSQSAELTLCHLAGYRMGAVVLPLFTLFGEEALEYRLANAEASTLITDMSQLPKVLAVRDRLPHLKTVIVIGAGAHGSAFLDWDRLSHLKTVIVIGAGAHGSAFLDWDLLLAAAVSTVVKRSLAAASRRSTPRPKTQRC